MTGKLITKEMIRDHAIRHDADFMGEIIVKALGIRGFCEGFCINRSYPNHYNLFWERNGVTYGETFSESDIMKALSKVTITVERK